ncbi:MAG: bifunctional DNA-formamidopyrimidine glycosylase/DNA-(apurinic or apyrimidinic site) lyase [Phycisphaerales bacterium]|nr:bifunctional DNA-formamidopyrimidine glycosylase/DNA-(apurinic or apyrimidinic site) lyase [Phycisphaerales bacterium]
MPELPEVEHLCRHLGTHIIGSKVLKVRLYRPDFIDRGGAEVDAPRRSREKRLMKGGVVSRILRHGKQFAIEAQDGRILSMHLGMSGRIQICRADDLPELEPHTHCVWTLQGSPEAHQMRFIDPRRFGGIWPVSSRQKLLSTRWRDLGPDALEISTKDLEKQLQNRSRPLKSALLDQAIVAGLGNIYVDEALFQAGLNPKQPVCTLKGPEIDRLRVVFVGILHQAISLGGSTVRTWLDSTGQKGQFTQTHQVYGRDGEMCMNCGKPLSSGIVSQRQTVWCTVCQPFRIRKRR